MGAQPFPAHPTPGKELKSLAMDGTQGGIEYGPNPDPVPSPSQVTVNKTCRFSISECLPSDVELEYEAVI